MTSFPEIRKIILDKMLFLQSEYRISRIGIFGSYARNEQKEQSDVDVLVEFSRMPGLFKFANLQAYLTELLGIRVDLVTKDALKPALADRILLEVVYL